MPQSRPQEFLIFQVLELTATNRTAWFTLVLQLENVPLEYGDQFVASTATEMGLPWSAVARAVHVVATFVYPEIVKAPVPVVY